MLHMDLLHTNILFIKFNNAFVFSDSEPPIINILYDLEYMATLNYVLFCFHLYNHQNYSFMFTWHLTFIYFKSKSPYGYVVILSKVCNL